MGIDRTKNLSGLLYPSLTAEGRDGRAPKTGREGRRGEEFLPDAGSGVAPRPEDRHLDRLYHDDVESRLGRQLHLDGAIRKRLGEVDVQSLERMTASLATLFLMLRETDAGLTWKDFKEALLRNFDPERSTMDRNAFELATGAVRTRIEMIMANERFGIEFRDLDTSPESG